MGRVGLFQLAEAAQEPQKRTLGVRRLDARGFLFGYCSENHRDQESAETKTKNVSIGKPAKGKKNKANQSELVSSAKTYAHDCVHTMGGGVYAHESCIL